MAYFRNPGYVLQIFSFLKEPVAQSGLKLNKEQLKDWFILYYLSFFAKIVYICNLM